MGTHTKGSVRATRCMTYLQGVDDTLMIMAVHQLVIFRVEEKEFGEERLQTLLLITFMQASSHLSIHGGNVINTLANGIHIHHTSTRQNSISVGSRELLHELQHILLVSCSTILLSQMQLAHEVMLSLSHLLWCGRSCTYVHTSIYLTAVTIDDRARQGLSQTDGHRCLAHGCRSHQYYQGHRLDGCLDVIR